MNRIKYILELNSIKPDGDITAPLAVTAEKKRKSVKKRAKALPVIAVLLSSAAVFTALFLIIRAARKNTPEPDVTSAVSTTEAPAPGPVERLPEWFSADLLYEDEYEKFRKTALNTHVSPDGTVTSSRFLPEYMDDVFEQTVLTLRADAKRFSAPSAPSDGEIAETDSGVYGEEKLYIIGSARYGTFEYLLTLRVTDNGTVRLADDHRIVAQTPKPGTAVFNTEVLTSAFAKVYKIRVENTNFVIYREWDVALAECEIAVSLFSSRTSQLESIRCQLWHDSGVVVPVTFKPKEYTMTAVTVPIGGTPTPEFISFAPEQTFEDRALVTDIINYTGMQWFTPVFKYKAGEDDIIAGVAIVYASSYDKGGYPREGIGDSSVKLSYYMYTGTEQLELYYDPASSAPRFSAAGGIPFLLCARMNGGKILSTFALPAGQFRSLTDYGISVIEPDEKMWYSLQIIINYQLEQQYFYSLYRFYGMPDAEPQYTYPPLSELLGLRAPYVSAAYDGGKYPYIKELLTTGVIKTEDVTYGKTKLHQTTLKAYEQRDYYITDINGLLCGVCDDTSWIMSNSGSAPDGTLCVLSDDSGTMIYAGDMPRPVGVTGRYAFEALDNGIYIGEFSGNIENSYTVSYIKEITDDGAVTVYYPSMEYNDPSLLYNGRRTYVSPGGAIVCNDPYGRAVIRESYEPASPTEYTLERDGSTGFVILRAVENDEPRPEFPYIEETLAARRLP